MSAGIYTASVVAAIPALGLLEDDVLLTDLGCTDGDPICLNRGLTGLPVAFVAKILLLAIASGNVRVTDPQFRADLELLASGQSPKAQPKPPTERRGLALV